MLCLSKIILKFVFEYGLMKSCMAGESHIDPIFGERPSRFAERVGQDYADSSFHKDKKHKGQFFTPLAISEFMGGLATPSGKKALSVMDPGCGLAILSCALIEHLVEKSKPEPSPKDLSDACF